MMQINKLRKSAKYSMAAFQCNHIVQESNFSTQAIQNS